MTVEHDVGAGASQAAEQPAGNGSAANEPSISVDDLVGKVAEQLLPRLSQEITGATKRHTASLREEITAMLSGKGNASAPKPGDDQTVSSERVKNTELNERLKQLEAENTRNKARAIRGDLSKAIIEARVHSDARELLVSTLSGLVKETDKGELVVESDNGPIPMTTYLAGYLKARPGLLESAARAGSGAGDAATSQFGVKMPSTKAELQYRTEKDAAGHPRVYDTPMKVIDFIKEFGEDAFNALPAGEIPRGRRG